MPDSTPHLHLDRLTIRVPDRAGLAPAALAEDTAQHLRAALSPITDDRHLGGARLRVHVPPGATDPAIAAAIARAIATLIHR